MSEVDVRTVDVPQEQVGPPQDGWIPLADGTRLAARIWRPVAASSQPVPAILEYLPYRKGDLTAVADASVASWFAAHGYAYVRVDIRGSGDSDGIIEDEYSVQEQDDAVEVIAWLASQPWCTGDVGMVGISWGGFNGLQIAARRPPALKAVVSMCSADDRYADDVHYYGGRLLATEMLPWSSVMVAINALPPDPAVVGNRWRQMWIERLERTPSFVERWVEHQRRDEYWRHGSVCEDYAAIECPVYLVGGWADGYTNTIPRFLEYHRGICKGLIGPWPHAWPHSSVLGPRIGFLQECVRWWDRWLRGQPNGIEEEPRFHVWMQEPSTAGSRHDERPGRWIALDGWPPSARSARTLHLHPGSLREVPPSVVGEVCHVGRQGHGKAAGMWCPYGDESDYAEDQREEDAQCLTFDSAPLQARLELLGRPRLRLTCSVDAPNAFVLARLCDVAPDGTSTLLTRGALNLSRRLGMDRTTEIVPGERMHVAFDLDVLGQALDPGHRLRLALSTTYWPWLWPSPTPVELTVVLDGDSGLDLPFRAPGESDGPAPSFDEPEQARSIPVEVGAKWPAYRRVIHDTVEQTYRIEFNQNGEERFTLTDTGVEVESRVFDTFTIREGDPLSAAVTCERRMGWRRGDVNVSVVARSRMTADAQSFQIDETIEAFEGDRRAFVRTWNRAIPRDGT
jgi:hypothetical protein